MCVFVDHYFTVSTLGKGEGLWRRRAALEMTLRKRGRSSLSGSGTRKNELPEPFIHVSILQLPEC